MDDRYGADVLAAGRRKPRSTEHPAEVGLVVEDVRLVVDCPFCGRPVEYPGLVGKGTPALAECSNPRCDVYFDFAVDDVYVLRS